MELEIREIRPDEVQEVSAFWASVGEPDADSMTPQKVREHIRKHAGLSLCAWNSSGTMVAVVLVTPVSGGHRMRLVADPTGVDASARQSVLNKATMKLAAIGVQRCQISLGQSNEPADDLLPALRWTIDEDFTPAAARSAVSPGALLDDSPVATEAALSPVADDVEVQATHDEAEDEPLAAAAVKSPAELARV